MTIVPAEYIVGLVDGEGCFCVTISKHKTKKLGYDARLMFEIEMVAEDRPLLETICNYFNCGRLYDLNYERYGWRPHVKYAVKSVGDIANTIIPFFKENKLRSKKAKDFELFCKAYRVFENKEHLTLQGLEKLRLIQQSMNIRSKTKWASAKVRENRVPGGD